MSFVRLYVEQSGGFCGWALKRVGFVIGVAVGNLSFGFFGNACDKLKELVPAGAGLVGLKIAEDGTAGGGEALALCYHALGFATFGLGKLGGDDD